MKNIFFANKLDSYFMRLDPQLKHEGLRPHFVHASQSMTPSPKPSTKDTIHPHDINQIVLEVD